mmetsp:Transcript_11542/g.27230  ORF Transcript_11542/g.27230 Transcript_11542/m.27230 type:complete len:216 (+) Transcript_11542:134-781(+)
MFDQSLRTRAAGTLRKECLASMKFHSSLKSRFGLAILANANVSGGDATDSLLILVKYNLAGGKSRIDLDAHLLGNTAQPPAQLPQTDDIIAIIVKLRRQEEVGNGIAGIFCQHEELVFRYGRGMRRLCILEGRRPIVSNVRKQLPERLGVEHIAREDVGANFASLFNNANTEVFSFLRAKLLESNRGRQTGRTTPDDEYIEWHGLSGSGQWVVFL